ncbi:cupin domain-containing protein [Candidatus Bipolaricaulota bacterium]
MTERERQLLDCAAEVPGERPLRIRLDRIDGPEPGRTRPLSTEGESLYILQDARGSLMLEGAGAEWKYFIGAPTAVWIAAGVRSEFVNTGDARVRGVRFGVVPQNSASADASKNPHSSFIVDLGSLAQRCMVSFLTRTVCAPDGSHGLLRLSEIQTILPGGSVPAHGHPDRSEACYVLCGTAVFSLAGSERSLSAGEALFIPPSGLHSVRNRSDEVLEYVIAQFGASAAVPRIPTESEKGKS